MQKDSGCDYGSETRRLMHIYAVGICTLLVVLFGFAIKQAWSARSKVANQREQLRQLIDENKAVLSKLRVSTGRLDERWRSLNQRLDRLGIKIDKRNKK